MRLGCLFEIFLVSWGKTVLLQNSLLELLLLPSIGFVFSLSFPYRYIMIYSLISSVTSPHMFAFLYSFVLFLLQMISTFYHCSIIWLCCWCSATQSCLTLGDLMGCSLQASVSFTISRSLPKIMSIASVMPSSHPIHWCPLLCLPSVFPTIRDFSNVSAVHIRSLK